MRRRTWVVLTCLALAVALLLTGPPSLRRVVSQTTRYSLAEILNMVTDENGVIQLAPWAGAQMTQRTAAEIFNLAFVPNPSGVGGYLSTSGGGGEGGAPGPNTIGPTELVSTAVTPGSYGTATQSSTITVDADGRITAASNTLVVPGANTITAGMIASTAVTPGSYGTATQSPTITVDADGRITAASNTLVVPGADTITAGMLASTAVVPGECGSGTETCVTTFDADGRATAATTTPIPGLATIVDELPAIPCVADSVYKNRITAEECICNADLVFVCNSPSAVPETVLEPGIALNAQGLQGLRYDTLELVGTCTLGTHGHVRVTAGVNGTSCQLPDAALLSTLTEYTVEVVDANPVTLVPFGEQLLNGVNGPSEVAIGPQGRLRATRQNATEWTYSIVTNSLTLDLPASDNCAPTVFGSLCFDTVRQQLSLGGSGINGKIPRVLYQAFPNVTLSNSTTAVQNFASVYTIPANLITAGKILEISITFSYVTDASPATQTTSLKLGGTVVWSNPAAAGPSVSANRSFFHTWRIIGTAAPGAAAAVRTELDTIHNGGWTGHNSTVQPVNLATNGTLDVVPTMQFSTNTAGESQTVAHIVVREYN
jgi:hypothetical protein